MDNLHTTRPHYGDFPQSSLPSAPQMQLPQTRETPHQFRNINSVNVDSLLPKLSVPILPLLSQPSCSDCSFKLVSLQHLQLPCGAVYGRIALHLVSLLPDKVEDQLSTVLRSSHPQGLHLPTLCGCLDSTSSSSWLRPWISALKLLRSALCNSYFYLFVLATDA